MHQTLLEMDSGSEQEAGRTSNGHFRQQTLTATSAVATVQKEKQQSLDSEKQVASSEVLAGPENAPTPIDPASTAPEVLAPSHEADKEVTSSWQTQSQDQSAPIPMIYHESNSPNSSRGNQFFNDVKGPPPAYDAHGNRDSTSSAAGATEISTPTSLEPDSPSDLLPPRPEDKSAVGQLLTWIPPLPRTSRFPPRLVQPVIIPQLDVPPQGESVPFQRCYSDALRALEVTLQDFTRFLDGLEVAQLPNSTLQGLRMFGVGVSHVPIPILGTLTGKGISKLASSGSGHSGSRARLYLEQARERYFKARGLRVTIVKDDDLNARLQLPAHAPRLGMLTQNTLSATCCQRRLEALRPYTAPLRYDVPDQDKQIQGVQKMARKHLNSRFKEKSNYIDSMRRRQWDSSASDTGQWEQRYQAKMSDVRAAQEKLIREALPFESEGFSQAQEELRLRQNESQVVISEKQSLERSADALDAEMEEVRWTRRLKWLVVENL